MSMKPDNKNSTALLSSVRAFVALATFSAFLCFGLVVSTADANDLGFRFNTTNVVVSNCTSNYTSYIQSTVKDYNDNTDLTMTLSSNQCTRVTYSQGDFGPTTWAARTIPIHNSDRPCADYVTGNITNLCNRTNFKATAATIYINDNGGLIPTSRRHFAMRHEMGHVFGLGHADCETDSVMKTADCPSLPSSLRIWDKQFVNSWY